MKPSLRVPAVLVALLLLVALAPAAAGQTNEGSTTTTTAPDDSTTIVPPDEPAPDLPVPEPTPEEPIAATPAPTALLPEKPGTEGGGESNPAPEAAGDPNTITVRKAIAPGDPTGQSFTISLERCTSFIIVCLNWTGVSSSSIADGGSHEFTGLTTGTRYRVIETAPSGWVATNVTGTSSGTCNEGATDRAVFGRWVNNASRDCTFNNANRRVSITKVADGPDAFTIELQPCTAYFIVCLSWGTPVAGGPASYSNGTAFEFTSLPNTPGNLLGVPIYRAVETFDDGYRLTDVTCAGGVTFPELSILPPGVRGRSFLLGAGSPTRQCTFTNTINRINVTKVSDPAGAPREFTVHVERCDFNVFANCLPGSWTDIAGSPFTVQPGDPTTELTGFPATLFERFFRIREEDPGSDWSVTADCDGTFNKEIPGTNEVAVLFPLIVNSAASAECTITNETTTGSITVEKLSNPAGGAGFDFTLEDTDDPSGSPEAFSLDDNTTKVFDDLFPSSDGGGYEILETGLPDAWILDDVDCGAATATASANGVTVDLDAGENVTCTFTNTNATQPGISLTKTPDVPTTDSGGTVTYTYVVKNTGPVQVDDLTVVDTPLGPVTLDRTTLGPAGRATDTATGTIADVVEEDGGSQVTNTALAEGFVPCDPLVQSCTGGGATTAVALADRSTLRVTGDANAVVTVAAPAGLRITPARSAAGDLARTGSDVKGLVLVGLLLVAAGGGLVLLRGRRRGPQA